MKKRTDELEATKLYKEYIKELQEKLIKSHNDQCDKILLDPVPMIYSLSEPDKNVPLNDFMVDLSKKPASKVRKSYRRPRLRLVVNHGRSRLE